MVCWRKHVGRTLKRAEAFRYVADYQAASVDLADARSLVADAESFVFSIRSHLRKIK